MENTEAVMFGLPRLLKASQANEFSMEWDVIMVWKHFSQGKGEAATLHQDYIPVHK